jgi:cell division cycle protein 20 (cofactor of APC complex)
MNSNYIGNANGGALAALTNSELRKKNHKTPIRTPLHLSSQKKKTPHTMTDDRYIPNRTGSNMEASYHILISAKDQENINNDINSEHLMDNIKRKLINDTCQGISNDKDKVLNLHSKQMSSQSTENEYNDNMKILYNTSMNSSMSSNGQASKKAAQNARHVHTNPDKILDAPDFKDDFYLNLIDWSSTNNLAVALNRDLYIWNAVTREISQLFSMDENTPDYITSVSWIQKGNILAVGNSKNVVELWDINKKTCLRQMKSHNSRIGCLSWNSHVLASGSRSGDIHTHDVRIAQHHTGTLKLHAQEVCGLKWNNDGRHLASGANDNVVGIWDTTSNGSFDVQPLHVLREHTAAVKAVSWCPWQTNILATGGGTLDRQIKIWNMYNGALLQNHDTKSQVSAILWSKNYREIVSSHGYQQNQLTIWKYPEMTKVCDLLGHSNRVLGMTMAPDEDTLVSVGADETLRFWKCFAMDEKLKRSKETLSEKKSSMQTGLSRCIR